MTKPFLLLQSRPEVEAADDEYQAFLKFSGLRPEELIRVRMDAGERPEIDFDEYSGIIMGGGPANFATPEDEKPEGQKSMEGYLMPLLERIIESDIPFLGACLGVGALVANQGGQMSFDKGEPVEAVDICLTDEGKEDALCRSLSDDFRGFVGHKEGVGVLPENAKVLAESDVCVQMIRFGDNVYATQFHPELDANGLALRIKTYKHAGYFDPDEADVLIESSSQEEVTEPERVLRAFVEKYRRQ